MELNTLPDMCKFHVKYTNTLFFPISDWLLSISYLGLVSLVTLSKGQNLVSYLELNFLSLSYIEKRIFDVFYAHRHAFLQLHICLDCTVWQTGLP